MEARTAFENAWSRIRRIGSQEPVPPGHRSTASWILGNARASIEDQGWRRTLRSPGLAVTLWGHQREPQWTEGDIGELIRLINRMDPMEKAA